MQAKHTEHTQNLYQTMLENGNKNAEIYKEIFQKQLDAAYVEHSKLLRQLDTAYVEHSKLPRQLDAAYIVHIQLFCYELFMPRSFSNKISHVNELEVIVVYDLKIKEKVMCQGFVSYDNSISQVYSNSIALI